MPRRLGIVAGPASPVIPGASRSPVGSPRAKAPAALVRLRQAGSEKIMHHAFAHFLVWLIIINAGASLAIVIAVRLFFRRGMDALDI